ncbi:Protein OBERON 1, partial [Dichanthelium oligosanthes]
LALREVAVGKVDLVAKKLKNTPVKQLVEIKSELWLILEGINGCRHIDEFLYLQGLVQGRRDLTPATLRMAHLVQLQVLVAIKTRNPGFVDSATVDIPHSHLAEVLLNKRCWNIACRSALPAKDCRCSICVSRSGFCCSCMCIVCNQFDPQSNSCRWIGCDDCRHWSHTDCAIRDGHVRAGPNPNRAEGSGYVEMLWAMWRCFIGANLAIALPR